MPTEHTISIVIPCKNRLAHLKQTLPLVLAQTWQDLEIIIVDYECPQKTFDWVNEAIQDKRVINFHYKTEKDKWNLSHSRNLGSLLAGGRRMLFLDADAMIKPTFIEMAVKDLGDNCFSTGLTQSPWNGCGCMFVWRETFFDYLGYNEAMEGWGYEDFEFMRRMEAGGLEHKWFNPDLIYNLSHDNESRNQYHGNEDLMECKERNYQKALAGEFKSCLK